MARKCTLRHTNGLSWRFEDGKPVSTLADEVVREVFLAEKQKDRGKRGGPPAIDLSFLKKRTSITYKSEKYFVPFFAVYAFRSAHHLNPCTVKMKMSRLACPCYIVNRKYCVPADECGNKMLLITLPHEDAYYSTNSSGKEMLAVLNYKSSHVFDLAKQNNAAFVPANGQVKTTNVGVHPLIDAHLLNAMNYGNQYKLLLEFGFPGHYSTANVVIKSVYNGILPVEVQQLVHKAKREYTDVVLVSEAAWEKPEVSDISPVDPLIIGLTDDRADLLCKFEETIEEHYMSSEFTKG
ncbi:MAG TPA: hypothetical protein HPP87_07235 [Planctomycetes bacterium]|nr:hypothetical protein [Planctomycetota bacterium]